MKRPDFNLEMSYDEFLSYYWYREELIQICREYHYPSYGSKAELNHRIELALTGRVDEIECIKKPKIVKVKKLYLWI